MNPRNTIERISETLQSLGCNDFQLSHSSTSFGCSSYLLVGLSTQPDLKVRVSDHSVTNTGRIFGEIHVTNESQVQGAIEAVERFFFPERYQAVTSLHFRGTSFEATEARMEQIKASGFEFRVSGERVSSRGKRLFSVDICDVERITYVRK